MLWPTAAASREKWFEGKVDGPPYCYPWNVCGAAEVV